MIDIREHVPLAPLTTFKIGGAARWYCEVKNEEELREALAWAQEKGAKFFILGGGSNILARDEGYDGLAIKMTLAAIGPVELPRTVLRMEAGCVLLDVIRHAGEHGLGGWEKLAGIPGTVGGAVRGNVGAFGSEIKDVVLSVRALNTETEEIHEFSKAECDFSYRHSFFKSHPEWIILSAFVRLAIIDPAESARLYEETIAEREKRHLQNVRAAGSYFMNPVAPQDVRELFEKEKGVTAREGRVPAGWLIEKVGMKGAMFGGAKASEQHPNYLVNMGEATAAEVRELAEKIKAAVHERFGIELEEEAAVFN